MVWTNLVKVFSEWWGVLPPALPWMAVLALVPPVAGLWLYPPLRRWLAGAPAWVRHVPLAVVLLSLAVGYWVVVKNATLYDDAYISFRYARNFADGHGLVWNLGERVEGYTNFLWTLLMGVLHRVTPWEAPGWGLWLCMVAFGAHLLVVWRIGVQLRAAEHEGGPWRGVLPLAVPLLALHSVFTDYGTSGMETMAASLLVSLGALALVSTSGHPARRAALAGSALVLAALTRPDHGLFYCAGGLALLLDKRPWRARIVPLAAYCAPFGAILVYLWWKVQYYGELLPNTYHAKNASEAYWQQGVLYTGSFVAGNHAWIPLALCVAWLAWPTRSAVARRFKIFAGASLAVMTVYITKVGGDFIYGRFFVPLIPLMLLGAEAFVHAAWGEGRRRLIALAAVGLLAATTQVLPMWDTRERPHDEHWGISDWTEAWKLVQWSPPVVDNRTFYTGVFFGEVLHERGIDVVLATGGIGYLGYHSQMPVLDIRGLTDPVIGRREMKRRGKPGHEKFPPPGYVDEYGVQFIRMRSGMQHYHRKPYRKIAKLEWDAPKGCGAWMLAYYDRELMATIAETAPELRFTDFEAHLDGWFADPPKKPARLARDARWFRRYYFDHNDDPVRDRRLRRLLVTRGLDPDDPRAPPKAPRSKRSPKSATPSSPIVPIPKEVAPERTP